MAENGTNTNVVARGCGVELLTQEEAAALLHKSPQVLRFWRTAGIGPAYVKLGKTVLYNQHDLITYIRRTLFNLPREPRSRRKTVALYKRGRFWHYEFQVNGNRYRGSTKQTIQTRARQVEVRKMQEAHENGYSPMPKKPPILRDFAAAVLKRFDNSSLDPDTKRYYRNGWRRLEATPLRA